MKRASEKETTVREVYVQCHFLGRGVSLDDLRDLVAATEDYDRSSRVVFEGKKITVTEVKSNGWLKRGRAADEQ